MSGTCRQGSGRMECWGRARGDRFTLIANHGDHLRADLCRPFSPRGRRSPPSCFTPIFYIFTPEFHTRLLENPVLQEFQDILERKT